MSDQITTDIEVGNTDNLNAGAMLENSNTNNTGAREAVPPVQQNIEQLILSGKELEEYKALKEAQSRTQKQSVDEQLKALQERIAFYDENIQKAQTQALFNETVELCRKEDPTFDVALTIQKFQELSANDPSIPAMYGDGPGGMLAFWNRYVKSEPNVDSQFNLSDSSLDAIYKKLENGENLNYSESALLRKHDK